jgi:hypothetical protein
MHALDDIMHPGLSAEPKTSWFLAAAAELAMFTVTTAMQSLCNEDRSIGRDKVTLLSSSHSKVSKHQ